MAHPPIKCRKCGLRLEDIDQQVEERQVGTRAARFVGDEEVCSCRSKPPVNPFTSRPQPQIWTRTNVNKMQA